MTKPLLLSLVMTLTSHAAEWEQLPPLPEPNGGCICGVTEGKIVLVGGTNWEGGTKNWLRAVHEYDPAARTWTKVKDLQEGPVAYGTALQNGASFAFIGGSDGKQALKAIALVDGVKTVLQPVAGLPAATVLAAGCFSGGSFIIAGGTDDAANVAGVQRLTHAVSLTDGQWQVRRLAEFPGKAFISAASAVAGDELCVFGGLNWDETKQEIANTNAAYAFSPAKNSWRALRPLVRPVRGLTAVALDEQRIYLGGGYAEAFRTEAFIYDVKTDSYTPAKPLPYAAMVSLVVCDGFVYCLGGEDKMKSRTDKFFRISVAELLK